MTLNEPASREAIESAEAELDARLPDEYVAFLLEHNGGEGPVGDEGWGAFHPIEDLPQLQIDYAELDHLAGFIVFGSDGGGEAFVFDGPVQFTSCPGSAVATTPSRRARSQSSYNG